MARRSIRKVVKAVVAAKTEAVESLVLSRANPNGKNPNPRPKIARRPGKR